MQQDDAPQDHTKGLGGMKKPLYVQGEDGEYTTVLSSGWDAEEVVLEQAIAQFESSCAAARQRVEKGLSSPLEYHMYYQRMDVTVLAQSTGFFRWQVRRHLKPRVFNRLSEAKLARYEEALGLSIETLQSLPVMGAASDD